MEDSKKPEDQMDEMIVTTNKGISITWSREKDEAANFYLSDSNVLIIRAEDERVLAVYNPLTWSDVTIIWRGTEE